MHYRTIVISDAHLGTPYSNYKKLLSLLENNSCDNLILAGDIIDLWYLKFFRGSKYKHIIEKILDLANKGVKITYLYGNHDNFKGKTSPIKGKNIEIAEDCIYKSGKKTYYICHGQQFDKKKIIPGLDTIGFLCSARLFHLNIIYNKRREKNKLGYYSLIKRTKWIAKMFMVGGNEEFENNVYKMITSKKADGLICGHLHKAEMKKIKGYDYLNSGDWIESCTALAETEENEWILI